MAARTAALSPHRRSRIDDLTPRVPRAVPWRDVPLRDMVAAALGCPVVLDNDANAAAYGEAWVGAGRGAKVLLLVTLGTGIGGGVVADGEVFHGARGLAVEVGHQVIVPGGRACPCGKRGCVEAYFSGHALIEQAVEAGIAGDGRPTPLTFPFARSPRILAGAQSGSSSVECPGNPVAR